MGAAALGIAGLAFAADEQNQAQPSQQGTQVQISADQHKSDAKHDQHAGMNKKFSVRRLSELKSGNIKNDRGEDLGRINGIAVDAGRGRIAYAVLSFGGALGVGDKEFAIPWKALKANIDHQNYDKISYTLNVDKSKLENAKGFDKDKWPDLADVTWGRDVHQNWGQRPYWEEDRADLSVQAGRTGVDVDVDVNRDQPTIQGTPISPEERQAGKHGKMSLLVRGDKLVGHDVVDQSGKDFADLEEIMVDPESGKLVYAILQVNEAPDLSKDYMNAVPFKLIKVLPTGSGNVDATRDRESTTGGRFLADAGSFKVMFNGSVDQLNNGPKFPERDWPMMDQNWGEQVYKHYGVQPFWKGGAAGQTGHSDRNTPDHQGTVDQPGADNR